MTHAELPNVRREDCQGCSSQPMPMSTLWARPPAHGRPLFNLIIVISMYNVLWLTPALGRETASWMDARTDLSVFPVHAYASHRKSKPDCVGAHGKRSLRCWLALIGCSMNALMCLR